MEYTLVFYGLNGARIESRIRSFNDEQDAISWAERQIADGVPASRRKRLWLERTGTLVWEAGDFII